MSHSTLALPAPDEGWILSSGGSEIDRGEDLGILVGSRSDVVVGLSATSVSSFVVDLPPVDAGLHESMMQAQVEKRGLSGKSGTLVDFERLHQGEAAETFVVRVVTELPGDLIIPTAAGYAPSASLRSIPPSGGSFATLWKEHGRFVLAVYVKGVPAHFQVLSGKPELGKATGQEINLILIGLKGESVFDTFPPRELFLAMPGVGEEQVAALAAVLPVPVKVAVDSGPAKGGEGRERLLPAAVRLARRKRVAVVRNIAIATAALVVYTVVGVWVWKDAQNTKREVDSLERRIAIIEPDVERVQLAEQRWQTLEPAFNKDLFPVVQLSRITAALPGSGVVIREYRTSGRTVRVRGQARDVQLANRLLEDLQAMEGFETYDWKMPNPKVERNNTATFEIEGRPKNATADR